MLYYERASFFATYIDQFYAFRRHSDNGVK